MGNKINTINLDQNAENKNNQIIDDRNYWVNLFYNESDIKYITDFEKDKNYPNRTVCYIPSHNSEFKESIFIENFDENMTFNEKVKECVIDSNKDRREEVKDIKKFPFSTIGIVNFKDSNGLVKYGTGTLISSNLILTCAHNVYDKDKGVHYKNHEFTIGLQNGSFYGYSKVLESGIFFPPEYIGYDSEDYAVLVLEENLGAQFGFMGFAPNYDLQDNDTYYLYGYPADKKKKFGSFNLWGMKVTKHKYNIFVNKNELEYNAFDTYGGQSGSGLWIKEKDGKAFVFGIHTCGNNKYNSGVYLNKKRYQKIIQWIFNSNINTSIVKQPTELNLWSKKIGEIGAKYLKECKFEQLNKLNLWGNNIGSLGVNYIKECKFEQLTHIDLSGNNIQDEGVNYLKNCYFYQLISLDLRNNNITCLGIKYLSCCDFKQLLELNLAINKIGNYGIYHLKNSKFNHLNYLDLNNNIIGDLGVKYLKDCKFKQLITLDLRNNNIGPKGAKYSNELNFKQLENLYIGFSSFDEIKPKNTCLFAIK